MAKKAEKPVKRKPAGRSKPVKKPTKRATKPAARKPKAKPAARKPKAKPSAHAECKYKFTQGGWSTFQFEDDSVNSHKFWEVRVDGNAVTTRWGRIGTRGQEKSFAFASKDAAMAEAVKKAGKKVKEGYEEA